MEIAEWKFTKYITITSLLFLIPAYYAYIHKLYDHVILLIVTSIISANYWRKATYSWRRNLDLIFSKISFAIYIYYGVKCSDIKGLICGILRLILMIHCFFLSCKCFRERNNMWVMYHCLFHILITIEQLTILKSIIHHVC